MERMGMGGRYLLFHSSLQSTAQPHRYCTGGELGKAGKHDVSGIGCDAGQTCSQGEGDGHPV